MKQLLYLTSFLLLIVVGCDSRKKSNYNHFRSLVSNEVFENFPISNNLIDKSTSQSIIFPHSISSSFYCGIFLEYNYGEIEFVEIVNILNSQKMFSSKVLDTCNIYISKYFQNKECNLSYYPVPAINDEFNPINGNTINDSSEFIIFSAANGNYIREDNEFPEFLIYKEEVNLPNNWKKGHSNGAIINYHTNQIIYWIVIW